MSCRGRLPDSLDITLIVNGSIMTTFTQKVPVPNNEMLNFELDLAVNNSCGIRLSVTARNQFGSSRPTNVLFGKTYMYHELPKNVLSTPFSTHYIKIAIQTTMILTTMKILHRTVSDPDNYVTYAF